MLQFLTGWKSSISTILKNSSSVDQGTPNLWSRCWCWSRSSKRNVIVSDARDSHCHLACSAGVDKSKVKLQVIFACSGPWAWKMGLSAGSLSPVSLSPSCRLCGLWWWLAQRRRETATNVKFLHSLVKSSQVTAVSDQSRSGAPSSCQLSPFSLNWSLLRRPRKIWSPPLHLRLKVLHPRKRLRILTWKRNSWLGKAYRSSAFQWHFCSKHFKHKNKCELGSCKSVKPFSRWHYFLRLLDMQWLVVKISISQCYSSSLSWNWATYIANFWVLSFSPEGIRLTSPHKTLQRNECLESCYLL